MGGAGGHMKHPFEVPGINTGVDLLNMFNTIARVASENQPTLKLDGANTSFKVIDSESNISGLEFALDRGSQGAEDIAGITLSNMRSRFLDSVDLKIISSNSAPDLIGLEFSKRADWVAKNTNAPGTIQPGSKFSITKKFTLNRRKMPPIEVEVLGIREHGLIGTTTSQLTLLNRVFEVYPREAKAALQALGMVDKSGRAIPESFLINTEYVDESESGGAANLISYGRETPARFLAFHGLIEIKPVQANKKRGKFVTNYPTYTVSGGSKGAALSKLTSLIEEANQGSGWEFFDASRYKVQKAENISSIDVTQALNQSITINTSGNQSESKTIRGWLDDRRVSMPPKSRNGYENITIMGQARQPVSKDVYYALIDPASGGAGPLSLEEMVGDNKLHQDYILSGAIFYHACKVIGHSIKSQLTNLTGLGSENLVTIYDEQGNATSHGHEGIAIQHPDFGIDPETGYPLIVKIVGDFLVTGAQGRFAAERSDASTEDNIVNESRLRDMIRQVIIRTIYD